MTITQHKIPIVANKNDVPSQLGDSNHPNDSLLCAKYNNLIDDLDAKLSGLRSVESVALTSVNGLEKTYTIYDSNSEALGNFVVTDGVVGTNGTDGRSIIYTEYNNQTGIITFTYSDNSTYSTPDLRGGGHIIQDEGVDLAQRAKLNFVGSGVVVTDSGNSSVVTINTPDLSGKMDRSVYDTNNNGVVDEASAIAGSPEPLNYYGTNDAGTKGFYTLPAGGSGGGGHIIQDEGVNLPARTNLNFVGAGVVATDTPTSTIVTIGQVDVSGKMDRSVYDSNNDGVVNNSDQLGGQAGSHYLSRANHTGTQVASTISDFSAATRVATNLVPKSVSANYTLQADDDRKWIRASGTIAITVHSNPSPYFECIVQNVGTGIITFLGISNAIGDQLTQRWRACHIYYDGSAWTMVGGIE